jgi:hypothetical protein
MRHPEGPILSKSERTLSLFFKWNVSNTRVLWNLSKTASMPGFLLTQAPVNQKRSTRLLRNDQVHVRIKFWETRSVPANGRKSNVARGGAVHSKGERG